jgi:unsaturated rhamnogalacturonyl hydrolase
MNADGSNLRRVTNAPAFDGYPVLIPDGSGILFVSTRSGVRNVYQINLAGDGLKALERRPGWQMDTPRPSQNGRLLVYAGGPISQPLDIYKSEFVSPLESVGQRGAANLAKQCDWEAGVLAYGWIRAWQVTREDMYRRWAQQWIDGCIPVKTSITHVNDGLLGYAALIAYEQAGGPERLAFAQRVADYLVNTAPRTADGTLTHDSNRVWADTLLGTVPFLIEMGRVSNNDIYTQEAITQALKHAEHLQDPSSGLYHHAWDASQRDSAGLAYWGRGNGWAMLADVAILSSISVTHPARPMILSVMQRQAAALKSLQDSSGLWHTVLTRSDFYLETSASALIGYALKRGIQEGWLDENTYITVTRASGLGVWHQVLADGTVANVSAPTGPMPEKEYNNIPRDSLQLYGQGVTLLLASSSIP